MKIGIFFLCLIFLGCFSLTDKNEISKSIDGFELYDKPVDLNKTAVYGVRESLYMNGDFLDTSFYGSITYLPRIINNQNIVFNYFIRLYDNTFEKKYLGRTEKNFSDLLCSFDLSKESLILNHPLPYMEKKHTFKNPNYNCNLSFLVEVDDKQSVRIRNVRLQYQSLNHKILFLPSWGFLPNVHFPVECLGNVFSLININVDECIERKFIEEEEKIFKCIPRNDSLFIIKEI